MMPFHRHRPSAETIIYIIHGHSEEYFYNDSRTLTTVVDMIPGRNVLDNPTGWWHPMLKLESGAVFWECKDVKYAPLFEDVI